MKQKFVFVRMDRIGDLVLTAPCDEGLRDVEVDWFVTKGTGFVLAHSQPPRRYHEFQKSFSIRNFLHLTGILLRLRPDGILIFHAPWWVSLAAFLARVPVRCGRRSQWHSFLFLNRGLRQHRHLSQQHELQYNLELRDLAFRSSLPDLKIAAPLPYLRMQAPERTLRNWGLLDKGYFVVHPGMGGSALNWPTDHYFQLMRQLTQYKPVVVTGTLGDRLYLEPLHVLAKDLSSVIWLNEKLTTEDLLAVFSHAAAVVAPSTGPLHLAAALGTPVVGLYSPVVAESARRWRPLGPSVRVLEGLSSDNANTRIRSILVEDVVQAVLELSSSK
jgi:ADP-heptose:LPS heptosyltransferase